MGAPLPALSRRPALVVLAALLLDHYSYGILWQLGCWIGTEQDDSGLSMVRNAVARELLQRSGWATAAWSIGLGWLVVWTLSGASFVGTLRRTGLLVDPRRPLAVALLASLAVLGAGATLFALDFTRISDDAELRFVGYFGEMLEALPYEWLLIGVLFGELLRSAQWRPWQAIVLLMGIEAIRTAVAAASGLQPPGNLFVWIILEALCFLPGFVFASLWRDGLVLVLGLTALFRLAINILWMEYEGPIEAAAELSYLGGYRFRLHMLLLSSVVAGVLRSRMRSPTRWGAA